MSYTADQLAALREAYASGVLEVTYSDGRKVRYQTMAEMGVAISRIERDMAPSGTRVSHYQPEFNRGL